MKSSKHIVFWSVAARNIQRFPARTISIFVPLFIVMTLASVMIFVKDGISHDALYSAGALADITVQQMSGGRPGLIQGKLISEIAALKNVRKVTPKVWGYVPLKIGQEKFIYTLMGIDPGNILSPDNISLVIEEGRFLNSGDKNRAVVGKAFAAQNMLKIRDKINFSDELGNQYQFDIVGIFNSSAKIYTANLIVTDINSAKAFLGYGSDQYSDLSVYLDDPSLADLVARSIVASHDNVRALTKDDLSAGIKRLYEFKSGIFQLMWLILLLTVLLLAWSEGGGSALSMKKEIGVLKAIGWRTLDIIEIKMMEIIIIGLSGITLGILSGILYVHLGAPIASEYFLGQAASYPRFSLPIYIEWGSLFLLFITGLFPLCAATIFPAWLMGTIEPDSAIRSE